MRQGAGLTQRTLAQRSGVAERTISDLERGSIREPRSETVDLLVEGLGLGEVDRLRLWQSSGREPASPPSAALLLGSRPWAELRRPLRGRATLLEALERAAAPGTLVTVTGPPGIGKSRLALELARRAEARGVTVRAADLASAEDEAEALRIVGAALGMPLGILVPAAVGALLGSRRTLLLIDNADRLAGGGQGLAAFASAAPALSVVVTSRAPLGVDREVVVPVPPLPVPDPAVAASPESLAANPAVLLFDDRARQAGAPDLLARPEGIASIVVRLDGVPLAIELAAAQAGGLSPSAMVDLLEHAGIALLHGPAGEGERRARMDWAIAWSADRLSAQGQRLLALLGAFVGGFSAEAVAAVAAEIGEPTLVAALPELLRSSLVHEASGETRFGMLEPVRLYAASRLAGSAHGAAVRRAHAAWFGRWARRVGRELPGPGLGAALVAVDADRANAFVAARWAVAAGEPGLAAAVALPFCRIWEAQGRFPELADLVGTIADHAAQISDRGDRVLTRWYAAYVPIQEEDVPLAVRRVRELREAEVDDPAAQGLALLADGMLALIAGEPSRALALVRESACWLDGSGHPYAWMPYPRLGGILTVLGEHDEARRALEPVVAEFDRRRDEFNLPIPLLFLGAHQGLAGRVAEARETALRILDLAERRNYPYWGMLAVAGVAQANAGSDDLVRVGDGALLYGASDRFMERLGLPYGPLLSAGREDALAKAARRLGAERVAALLEEGAKMSLAQAKVLASNG